MKSEIEKKPFVFKKYPLIYKDETEDYIMLSNELCSCYY